MKILFLDVDGVLVTGNSIKRAASDLGADADFSTPDNHPSYAFNYTSLLLLQQFVETTKVKIVVSSSWRENSAAYNWLLNNLKKHHIDSAIVGTTPSTLSYSPRGLKIRQWLLNYPQVDHIVILDDDTDMHPFEDYLVLTDFATGFCVNKYKKALQILEKPFNRAILEI